MLKTFTIWRFTAPSSNAQTIVVRASEPDDRQVQHQFQRILWRDNAATADEAMRLWQAA